MPFPHANAAAGGWKAREEQCNKRWVERAFINLFLILVGIVSLGLFAWGVVVVVEMARVRAQCWTSSRLQSSMT